MAKPGPPPTPTNTLKRRGSWLAKTRPHEPRPDIVLLPQPATLSKGARRFWKPLAKALFDAGLSTALDSSAIAQMCECQAELLAAQEGVDAVGIVCMSQNGSPYQNPAIGVLHKAREQLLRLEKEFGMTPSSRTGVHAAPSKEGDLVEGGERFVKRGKKG